MVSLITDHCYFAYMRNIYFTSILLALQLSCFIAFAQTADTVKIVAHRGGVQLGPENTLVTFLKAAELGVDYVEMDIRQTKDGEFVLMHDPDVKRTTNGNSKVKDMTLAEIKELDAGSWYGEDFAGEKVPTLKEVLRGIKGKILPDLDFKAGDPKQLIELLKAEGYLEAGNVTLYSGNYELLKEIGQLTDKLLLRPSPKGDMEYLMKYLDAPIVNLSGRNFSAEMADQIHKHNKKAFVNCLFNADKKKLMVKALKYGADYIQTDQLDVLIPLVRAHNKTLIEQTK